MDHPEQIREPFREAPALREAATPAGRRLVRSGRSNATRER